MPMMTLNFALLFVSGLAFGQFLFVHRENLLHCFLKFVRWFLLRRCRHGASYAPHAKIATWCSLPPTKQSKYHDKNHERNEEFVNLPLNRFRYGFCNRFDVVLVQFHILIVVLSVFLGGGANDIWRRFIHNLFVGRVSKKTIQSESQMLPDSEGLRACYQP
jgi:hypothetical protein